MKLSHSDREQKLAPIIAAYKNMPFLWAAHDCVLFAARCVDAQIGTFLESLIQRDFRYNGPIQAMRLVTEAGGWEPLVSRYLGASVPPERIEFGDVVLGRAQPPFERTSLLGVCDEELFIAPGSMQLEFLPMENAIRGWKLESIPLRIG
jgi:hypothetical protein